MPKRSASVLERFWAKVDKTETCWLWTAPYRNRGGYGQFRPGGKDVRMELAHRFAYATFRGPIPEGLVLDHLCRVRNCVNPDHLEPVTNQVNLLRGEGIVAKQARQTHCSVAGHELPPYESGRKRRCPECRRIRSKRLWQQKLAQRQEKAA